MPDSVINPKDNVVKKADKNILGTQVYEFREGNKTHNT